MAFEKKTIGFIGLGVMGNSMAGHLLSAGHRLIVHTRSPAKAKALLDRGAEWAESPAALAPRCDVIVTMVGLPSDVEEVYMGENGLLAHARKGALLIDMTTSSPDLAVRIHAAASAKGLKVLDAPVSGGDTGARNATLTIMAGGDEDAFAEAEALFAIIGKTIVRQGGAGAGQHTKAANQICVAANLIGVVEALSYASASGLDPKRVLLSIGGGSAASWQLSGNAPRMLDEDFNPGFYAKHFLKDLRIALDSSKNLGLTLPLVALAESLFEKVLAQGWGERGTQILYEFYRRGLV
ncbi:MAG: NAD(P)-dependent oxidoreductase [Spirochaetia bacterium]|jgi:3-hydroxyisobutyrate dehydrogenase|nr:NAD(P)-dependent oxidoreductase [Spirochaetia bacterium]